MNLNKVKEPYVLMLIGPPLSGKTTWINNNFSDKEVTIISRDQIVLDIAGTNDYNYAFKTVNQKEIDRELQSQIKDASSNKENTIVDMTNMTSKRRSNTLSNFGDEYTKIGVIFPIVGMDEYKRRNDKRELEESKFIPEHVIKRMISSYQKIREDEGFDKIISL